MSMYVRSLFHAFFHDNSGWHVTAVHMLSVNNLKGAHYVYCSCLQSISQRAGTDPCTTSGSALFRCSAAGRSSHSHQTGPSRFFCCCSIHLKLSTCWHSTVWKHSHFQTPTENPSIQTHLVLPYCIKCLCIFGPKGAIQIRYYYYYTDRAYLYTVPLCEISPVNCVGLWNGWFRCEAKKKIFSTCLWK